MDDIQMVEAIKAGDKEAFNQLYEEYSLRLYRTAYLIVGNSYDAEDVLQDTFVSAYKNISDLKDHTKLKTWLYAILKNRAYKKYNKNQREFPEQDILEKIEVKGTENIKEDRFALKDEIQICLMKLKPKLREVIVLYYYNDFTIAEIAQICGSFQGTVKSRLYKARKDLKRELEKLNSDVVLPNREEANGW